MSPPTNNPYPNAEEVLRQISRLTQGEECIFRGEPEIYSQPCTSSLYRQLRKADVTDDDMPVSLKKRQDKLIASIRRYEEEGNTDLRRLMAYQHKGGKTNLLDFTGNKLVALFFACFGKNPDQDAQVIVKQRGNFDPWEEGVDELPTDKVVMLKPPKALLRAKDQSGVLIYAPGGSLLVVEKEIVVIKAEWKQEILDHLKNEYDIFYETIFDDMHGVIEQQDRGYEKQAPHVTQSVPSLQGFAESEDNGDILNMEQYKKLLDKGSKSYIDLLRNYADILLTNFTKLIENGSQNAETYYNRAFVYQSKPDPRLRASDIRL